MSSKAGKDRFYVEIEDKWRHIYLVSTYEQVDIFGDNVKIARVRLTKGSKTLHEVEFDKLADERPKTPRKERVT